LSLFEKFALLDDYIAKNKTYEDLKEEWKEEQMDELYKLNYEEK